MKKTPFLVSAAEIPALRTIRATLADLVTQINAAGPAAAAMRADESSFVASIESLELTADYRDTAAVRRIVELRGQLDLVRRQAIRLEDSVQPLCDTTAGQLESLGVLILRAVRPAREALESEIATALRPIYGQNSVGLEVALRQAPKLASFNQFFGRNWLPAPQNPVGYARIALPIIDALIEGANPWTFQTEAA